MPLKIALIAAVVAFLAAWQVQAWRYDSLISEIARAHAVAMQKAESRARTVEQVLAKSTSEIDRLSERAQQGVRVVTETVEKEVVRYVQKDPAAGACQLPAAWVRAHNNATRAKLPEGTQPAGPFDDPPNGVTDIDALRTVTANYRTCVADAERLVALQSYVDKVCLTN